MWNKGDWVIVINSTFGKGMVRKDISFKIAQVLEIGLDDLFVKHKQNKIWDDKRSFFVPKSMCQQIPVQSVDLYESIRKPKIGDLVLYYNMKYTGEVTQCVSHVLELRSNTGDPPEALINLKQEHTWVTSKSLLVLSVNNTLE